MKTTQKELAEALNMTQNELDRAAYNILQAETHLLGGDLLEMMSQQHELQLQEQANKEQNQQQVTSQNIAQQLNPSAICDIEEEQAASNQADVFLMKDSHSPISFSSSDEEEDTKL